MSQLIRSKLFKKVLTAVHWKHQQDSGVFFSTQRHPPLEHHSVLVETYFETHWLHFPPRLQAPTTWRWVVGSITLQCSSWIKSKRAKSRKRASPHVLLDGAAALCAEEGGEEMKGFGEPVPKRYFCVSEWEERTKGSRSASQCVPGTDK